MESPVAEAIPALDVDPFSDQSLAEPCDYYCTLRDASHPRRSGR